MKLQSKQPRSHVLPPRTAATTVVNSLSAAHEEGHAWGDMAVICRRYDEMDECAQALSRWKLPHQVRKGAGSFNRLEDIHQRIGGEIHPKQVKRTLEELTAKGSVRFEGDKRWRRYWAVPQ